MEINERIKLVVKRSGMTQTQVAEKVGITESYMNRILNSKNKPSLEIISKIAGEFGISQEWLLTGEGVMKLGDEPIDAKNLKEENESLKDELLSIYRFLAERGLKFERRAQIGG